MLKHHSIFMHISDERPMFGEIPQDGWNNTSNHNSCWRQGSSKITMIGFNCHDNAHLNCPKKYRPSSRDESINFDLGFGICGEIFKLIKVEKECFDEYHYNLTAVNEIKHKLVKC